MITWTETCRQLEWLRTQQPHAIYAHLKPGRIFIDGRWVPMLISWRPPSQPAYVKGERCFRKR